MATKARRPKGTGYVAVSCALCFVMTQSVMRLRGGLWGLDAYLAGHDEDWLSCNKPECAGAPLVGRLAAKVSKDLVSTCPGADASQPGSNVRYGFARCHC